MTGRCKTCAHWKAHATKDFEGVKGSGTCDAALPIWQVSEIVKNETDFTFSRVLKPEHAGVLAMVEDGSAYRAILITMPDFGCVMHKP